MRDAKMTVHRKPSVAILLVTSMCTLMALNPQCAAAQAFSIRIKMRERRILAGASIVLRIKVVNTSKQEMVFPRVAQPEVRDQIEVWNDGEQLKRRDDLAIGIPHAGVSADTAQYLEPRESLEEDVDISRSYDFGSGNYSVRVSRVFPSGPGDGVVRSNIVRFTIVGTN